MLPANKTLYKTRIESQLKTAKDIIEFKHVARLCLEELGFSGFTLADLYSDGTLKVKLTTLPQKLLDQYMRDQLANNDAWAECCFSQHRFIYRFEVYSYALSSPYETEKFKKNETIHAMLKTFGIYDSLTMTFNPKYIAGVLNRVTVLEIYCYGLNTVDFKEKVTEENYYLILLTAAIYKLGYSRFVDNADDNPPAFKDLITKRELEVLRLYPKCEFSTQKVAVALNRSKFTIQKHTENIRNKLNVKNTYEAVILGAKQGLIQL